ncbi:MAG TPA: hypothetical protein VGD56_20495, partial [Gemmatirosa sp.]
MPDVDRDRAVAVDGHRRLGQVAAADRQDCARPVRDLGRHAGSDRRRAPRHHVPCVSLGELTESPDPGTHERVADEAADDSTRPGECGEVHVAADAGRDADPAQHERR